MCGVMIYINCVRIMEKGEVKVHIQLLVSV